MARDHLIERILDGLLLLGSDADRLAGAAARFNSLNRTDLRALQALRGGGMTAGRLARALGVTTGATTRVIDSLVARGHVARGPDPTDRRRVLVRLTTASEVQVDRTLEQFRAGARSVLGAYGDEQIETVARFLEEVRALVRAQERRLAAESRA